jgi:hypothetical protein
LKESDRAFKEEPAYNPYIFDKVIVAIADNSDKKCRVDSQV